MAVTQLQRSDNSHGPVSASPQCPPQPALRQDRAALPAGAWPRARWGSGAGFPSHCSEFGLTEVSGGGMEGGWCEMVPEFDTSWLCARSLQEIVGYWLLGGDSSGLLWRCFENDELPL